MGNRNHPAVVPRAPALVPAGLGIARTRRASRHARDAGEVPKGMVPKGGAPAPGGVAGPMAGAAVAQVVRAWPGAAPPVGASSGAGRA